MMNVNSGFILCLDGQDPLQQMYKYIMIPMISGEGADPGSTAMPGQLVTKPEQAPELHPLTKISLISKRAHGSRIRY